VERDKLGAPRGAKGYRRIGDQQRNGLFFDGISVWSPVFLLWAGGQGSYLGFGEADGRESVLEVIEK